MSGWTTITMQPDYDEVDHGISIIEDEWRPKVAEEKGREAIQ